jgi:Protein of unknown function (DUF3551)
MQKLIVLTAAVVTLALTILSAPANARSQQWCLRREGANHCMYATEEQCRASASGRGGTCSPRRHR